MTKIRKAVSIIFKFENKVFTINRQNFLSAFPGYTAFPGGKVDRSDEKASDELTLIKTLYREAMEELAIDIEIELLNKNINSVTLIAKATSPDFNPRRFETYFYLVDCLKLLTFQLDHNEFQSGVWLDADEVIKDYENGDRLIVKPVLDIFKLLQTSKKEITFFDFDKVRKDTKIPFIENIHELIQFMPLSNTIIPADRTNCFYFGEKNNKWLIDPSPKNEIEYQHLLDIFKGLPLDKILISHHHKDHHQFANKLARDLSIPIYCSLYTFERIKKIYGSSYFDHLSVHILEDGDVIGKWKGEDVLVHAIPGHDEGHLGFAPRSLKWFIVGDLFQGIGTVVVGGEEGDMAKYLLSLEKVIQLNPKCVIPSHGIPLGGTNILQKTLDHRLIREKQIKEFYLSGLSVDEILTKIYSGVPVEVHRYAKMNIESHLFKLKFNKEI